MAATGELDPMAPRKLKEGEEMRSVFIGLKLRPSLKVKIEKAAKSDNRTMSQWIETVILEKLRALGEIDDNQS